MQCLQNRPVLTTYLNAFDISASSIQCGKPDEVAKLLYIVDTLATLPYATQDEPLWLLNAIDVNLSVSGSAVLERFRSTCIRPYKTNGENVENEKNVEKMSEPDKIHEIEQNSKISAENPVENIGNPEKTVHDQEAENSENSKPSLSENKKTTENSVSTDANDSESQTTQESESQENSQNSQTVVSNHFEEPDLGDCESYELLEERLSRDELKLNTFYHKLLACFLLHALKAHMRLIYCISDRKIQEYIRITSVSEAHDMLNNVEPEKGENKIEKSGNDEDWKDDLKNGAGSKKDCIELDIAPDVLAGMSEKEIKAAKKAKVKAAKSKRSETIKQFDRLTNRRHGIDFDAQQSLKIVKDYLNNYMNYNFTETTARLEVIHQYTVFRQLLEQIDRHDEDSGDEEGDILNQIGMKTRKSENTDENEIIERIDQTSLEDSTKEEADVVKPKGRRLISTAEVQARKSSNESDASSSFVKPKVGRTLINTSEFKTEKPKVGRTLIDTNMFKKDNVNAIDLTEDLSAKPKKSKKSKKNKRKRKRDYEDTASTTEEEEDDDNDDFTHDNHITPKYQSNDLFAPDNVNNPFKSSY